MHPSSRSLLALALAVALGAQPGCHGPDQSVTGETAQAAMSNFADGYNAIIQDVPSFFSEYGATVPEDGPTAESYQRPAARLCGGIWRLELPEVRKAFDVAKNQSTPDLKPLGPLADALYQVAAEVTQQRDALCKYLKAEDYKDDGLARGKQLHSEIVASMQRYRSAVAAMSDALDVIEDRQMEAEVAKFAKEKGYGYWWRYFNLRSKQFITGVRAAPDQYLQQFDAWERDYRELSAFTAGKGTNVVDTFQTYQEAADRLYAPAKKLRRAVEEAAGPEAAAAAVDEEFNRVITGYNNLIALNRALGSLESVGKLD